MRKELRNFLNSQFGFTLNNKDPVPSQAPNGALLVYGESKRLVCPDCLQATPEDVYFLDARALARTADTYPVSHFPETSIYRINAKWGLQCTVCYRWLVPEMLACDGCSTKSDTGDVTAYPDGLQLCQPCKAEHDSYRKG